MKIIGKIDDILAKRKENLTNEELRERVLTILNDVKLAGNQAVIKYTELFDGVKLADLKPIEINKLTFMKLKEEWQRGIKVAIEEITSYHEKQKINSWLDAKEDGTILGQIVRPLERVGIYVPGGTARYPSSVLMNAIPAIVAGVEEIVMVTPPAIDSETIIPEEILYVAHLLGIKEIYPIGGVQGIAALAYGTETIKKVDKIVGPGNRYVALAKKEVYPLVDIDMIAGPSEVCIIADETSDPEIIAADMLAQAEHDGESQAILLTPSHKLAERVEISLTEQLEQLPRQRIAEEALSNNGRIVLTTSIKEAIELANKIAPEHLELLVEEPFNYLGKVKNAGAIFLGKYTAEALGDYIAGPNHVLPTNGTARFRSPLGVYDFLKRISILSYSKERFSNHQELVQLLAKNEGLEGHAKSISIRKERL